jgi:hypothetical protein
MVDKIADVLIKRDGYTREDAEREVEMAREELMARIGDGEMPFDFCEEWFGLEPDYLDELIF